MSQYNNMYLYLLIHEVEFSLSPLFFCNWDSINYHQLLQPIDQNRTMKVSPSNLQNPKVKNNLPPFDYNAEACSAERSSARQNFVLRE